MKILIIDDSHLLQSRLKKALIEINPSLSISQAFNCNEALELFTRFSPTNVILDIALPDGSGINLLRKFKMEAPEVIVTIFTNYPVDELKKSCFEYGADYFYDKSNMARLINSYN